MAWYGALALASGFNLVLGYGSGLCDPEYHVVGSVTSPLTMRATRHVFSITTTCVYPCGGRAELADPHLHRPLREWPPWGGRPMRQIFTIFA